MPSECRTPSVATPDQLLPSAFSLSHQLIPGLLMLQPPTQVPSLTRQPMNLSVVKAKLPLWRNRGANLVERSCHFPVPTPDTA